MTAATKKRKWDSLESEDPGAGLVNLFDVWMVFAIALLLALVSYHQLPRATAKATAQSAKEQLESVSADGVRLERLRVTEDELSGEGKKLGTAYRLSSGEVVYVPDSTDK